MSPPVDTCAASEKSRRVRPHPYGDGMIASSHHRDPQEEPSARPRIDWGSVVGFGTLGLLWPVLRLMGLEAVIGGTATALVVFLTVAAVWTLGAGYGLVPRPVATLTLSGVMFAVLLGLTSFGLGEWPDCGIGQTLVAAVAEIGRSAGLGALAGLVAEVIQKRRSR